MSSAPTGLWQRLVADRLSPRTEAIVIAVARLFATVIGIVLPIVLVRALDQTEFGQYKQVFLVVTTLAAVFSFAMPASLYYLVARHPKAGAGFLAQTFWVLCTAGAVVAVLVWLGAAWLQRFVESDAPALLHWTIALAAFSVPAALLPIAPAVQRHARLAGFLIASVDLVRALAMVLAALAFHSVVAVLAAATAVAVASTLGVGAYILWSRRRAGSEPGRLREQIDYCAPMAAASYVGLAREQFHSFYVGAAFSPAQFAVYAVGTMNVPLIGQLSSSLGDVLVLEASKHHAADDVAELRRVWHRVTDIHALIMLPACIVLMVYARDLVTVMYGRPYEGAATILRVFLLLLPIRILMTSPMLRAIGDSRSMFVADAASLTFALLTIVPLVRHFGAGGAVASLLVGSLTFQLVAARPVARRLGLSVVGLAAWSRWLYVAMLCLLCAALPWLLLAQAPAIVRLLAGGLLTAVAYATCVLKLRLLPDGEHGLAIGLLRRFAPARLVALVS